MTRKEKEGQNIIYIRFTILHLSVLGAIFHSSDFLLNCPLSMFFCSVMSSVMKLVSSFLFFHVEVILENDVCWIVRDLFLKKEKSPFHKSD